MLIDTHCHLNMIVKKNFDQLLTQEEIKAAASFIEKAAQQDVRTIINVGTSVPESINCVTLAHRYPSVFAAVGMHPNDLTDAYKDELRAIEKLVEENDASTIVGIGECGMDKHYPNYDLARQEYGFRFQIELALKHNRALVVHTRDARDETLRILEEYHNALKRCIIHCFSEDADFARTVISWGFYLGIGGTLTYPKNNALRAIIQETALEHIVLETDAPFLPPQSTRGQQNTPQEIFTIANYLANLKNISYDEVAKTTSMNAKTVFTIK